MCSMDVQYVYGALMKELINYSNYEGEMNGLVLDMGIQLSKL